jgi:hypothetical protein
MTRIQRVIHHLLIPIDPPSPWSGIHLEVTQLVPLSIYDLDVPLLVGKPAKHGVDDIPEDLLFLF